MLKNFQHIVFILCLGVAYTLAAEVCDDIDATICQEMNTAIPNMCSDSCLAAHCKRFCGKCPLVCYECHEVDHPANCTQTVVCPSSDHYCVATQTFTDDFREVYKLGCALSNLCAANFVDNNVLGRRGVRSRANLAGGCCKNDLCNNQHPSNMTALTVPDTVAEIVNVTQPSVLMTSEPESCQDIPGNTCLSLALSIPSMCQSDCLASRVCPRTCALCVECYACQHVLRPEDCNKTKVCHSNQECFSLATLDSFFQRGYRLGCLDRNTCANFDKPNPNAFGRRQNFEVGIQGDCCHFDFCNHHVIKPTTQQPTITTTTTNTITTVTQQNCRKRYTRCPHNFAHDGNSCYLVGPTALNWTEAEAYCVAMCTDLADFDDDDDIHDVNHLLRHYHDGSFEYYTAAKASHGHWQWSSSGKAVPSHIMQTSSTSSMCGVLRSDSLHRLDASSCTEHHQPLCELKLHDDK